VAPECRSLARRKLTQMEALERDAIVRSLEDNANNKLQAAIALGMSRATIYRKMRDWASPDPPTVSAGGRRWRGRVASVCHKHFVLVAGSDREARSLAAQQQNHGSSPSWNHPCATITPVAGRKQSDPRANVGDAVAYRYLDYTSSAAGSALELTWTELGNRMRAIGAEVQRAASRGDPGGDTRVDADVAVLQLLLRQP
jgi:hypothetical protein